MEKFAAGAAEIIISPEDSQFLSGYPHVKRYSTGIHDDLLSSALYIQSDSEEVLFISNDIIYITKKVAREVRKAISGATGIDSHSIIITATHTHSGPKMADYISNSADPAVPPRDPAYEKYLIHKIAEAGIAAWENRKAAEAGLSIAIAEGIGTNRRNPDGPADQEVPVLMVREPGEGIIACMAVYSMHPTVLHEDSTLVSADFPGMARKYVKERLLKDAPFLYHTGPAGNQSPRHVTQANTFEEAERLGALLGEAIVRGAISVDYHRDLPIKTLYEETDLPEKEFSSEEEAKQNLSRVKNKFESLKQEGSDKKAIRTAECDWFGAEETLTLSRAQANGELEEARRSALPAEISLVSLGPWKFLCWPGEIFVEYSLKIKKEHLDTFLISLANGELQGYIVTEEAYREGGYEAGNALFPPQAGHIFVEKSKELLDQI